MDVQEFLKRHPEWKGSIDLVIYPPTWEEALKLHPELEYDQLEKIAHHGVSPGVSRLAVYMMLRAKKSPHKLALMVACQRGPRVMTDAVFFERQPRLADQFVTPQQMAKVIAIAKRNGYTPNSTDVYLPEIAAYQGDPLAFVPATGGRSHIKKVLEKRGWQSDGAVTTPYVEPASDPHEQKVALAPDIVKNLACEMVKKDPSLRRKTKAELTEKVLDKHA